MIEEARSTNEEMTDVATTRLLVGNFINSPDRHQRIWRWKPSGATQAAETEEAHKATCATKSQS